MRIQIIPSLLSVLVLTAAVALTSCDEKRVDKVPGGDGSSATTAPAQAQGSSNAVTQAERRAAAAAQRLQEAQTKASTDQEKEDAVKQYEAERQAIANGTDSQSTASSSSGDSAPPPQ